MKLDTSFAREITKANGDGSREAKFAFLHPIKEAAQALSTPDAIRIFGSVLKKYGRATVGIVVAATIIDRSDRLNHSTVLWAFEVMRLWTTRPNDVTTVAIQDSLHPSKIEIYAGPFIRATTDEA